MSRQWGDFAEHYKSEISYAPLALDAIPQIQMQAQANLRNVTPDGTGFRATCPFHQGDASSTATLRVNLDPSIGLGIGFFKCYSCKTKGHWNKLAAHVGIDPLTGDANPEIKNLLMPIREERNQYRPPRNMQPWPAGTPWKRYNKNNGTTTVISPYAMELLGAMIWRFNAEVKKPFDLDGVHYPVESTIPETRMWIPVLDKNTNLPIAHVAALLSTRYPGSKKYLNSSGPWSKKHIAFYAQALKLRTNTTPLVLVEGAADAMRLLDANIPACPLLGVDTWTELKTQIVACDYSRVVVCLDGDGAGQPAQVAIAANLNSVMSASTIQMPAGEDPASFPEPKFRQLVQKILSKR